ncbi:pilus assembly FimT family protein [Merismopedia glauca]|uniref:Prepilin-type cleavage/methylation domain-containing protein n=1 Tax=Merismopedia glauca CCAP 1448/3 TaxID=1296344 RepID=A0A2T1C444_9CYAN|nr:type II secretion system protein [Merismopedia glauca]PSB02917.1 hypothetical protein C7B64_10730 [Merismopedia glauca CCAP 1448/3]
MLPLNVRKNHKNKGFTLLEMLIIVLIIGIGFAIATPSFLSSMEKLRLEQAVVEVRSAFREAQRQAIRNGISCLITLNIEDNRLTSPCLNIGDRTLSDKIKLATNIELSSTTFDANYHPDSSYLVASTEMPNLANLGLNTSNSSIYPQTLSANCNGQGNGEGNSNGSCEDNSKLARVNFGVLGTAEFKIVKPQVTQGTPIDPSAKIIFYTSNSSKSSKKCLAISNTLGLTRAGTYNGSTEPEEITGSGICMATE